ncbi:hypothetical protein FKM82_007410 [Ascaphus truei]
MEVLDLRTFRDLQYLRNTESLMKVLDSKLKATDSQRSINAKSFQTASGSDWQCPEYNNYVEVTDSCSLVVVEKKTYNATNGKPDEKGLGRTEGGRHHYNIFCHISPGMLQGADSDSTTEFMDVSGSPLRTSDLLNDNKKDDLVDAPFSPCAYNFDGPYLLCPSN